MTLPHKSRSLTLLESGSLKLRGALARLCVLGLTALLFLSCGGKGGSADSVSSDAASLIVSGGDMTEGVAPVTSLSSAKFYAVWVGSYLDVGPAQRAVSSFQKQGFTSFSVKKTLEERSKLITSRKVGDFFLVLVGLFAEKDDANNLGKRLQAQGLVGNWQLVPSDKPSELDNFQQQTQPLVQQSESVTTFAQEKAGAPLSPKSPVVTGEGFRKMVYGRFIGSYRDPLEAKQQARRLTSAGWPAAVEETREGGGMWYRVYLAESKDPVDFKTTPAKLDEARGSAMRQPGMVLLIDGSGLKGVWGTVKPLEDRTDASACAGYSQAGRMLTSIERLVSYIPDNGALMMVKPLAYKPPSNIVEKVTRPVKNWWTEDDSSLAEVKAPYGPAIYNRPEVLKSIKSLKVDVKPAPLAPELQTLELAAIPGKKTVILFSDFRAEDTNSRATSALGGLKGQYGGSLDFIVVYGDTDDVGYKLAGDLAQTGGGGEAWSGCQLLADNAYFERFIKRVFRR
ncbi:MAG: SPOR domain-containing protein [Deltaproteobacteria bacterium]|jgi:hypothetical protein|nr:SPOR domain-containing protein [Deltaproteobacteria bacterium]